MRRLIIVPSKIGDVYRVAANMRAADAKECVDLGFNPMIGLRMCYKSGIMRKTVFVDGRIAAMAGLCGNLISDEGLPYLFTTAAVERAPIAFVKAYLATVDEMLSMKRSLMVHVAANYHGSIRLLRMAGFSIGDPAPMGTGIFCVARLTR